MTRLVLDHRPPDRGTLVGFVHGVPVYQDRRVPPGTLYVFTVDDRRASFRCAPSTPVVHIIQAATLLPPATRESDQCPS